MAIHYLLEFYGDDDATVATSVSTDPAHARPWLVIEDYGSEAELDFLNGSATIGEIRVRIVDPQTGGTQADRGFTALLANADGVSALSGRRAVLREVADGTPGRVLKDGVVGDIELAENASEFPLSIRDIRERERTTPAFTMSGFDTPLPPTAHIYRLFPPGIDGGYGRRGVGDAPRIPDRRPTAVGTCYSRRVQAYTVNGQPRTGHIAQWIADHGRAWYGLGALEDRALINARAQSVPVYDEHGTWVDVRFSDIVVRWRTLGSSTWTVLRDMPAAFVGGFFSGVFGFRDDAARPIVRMSSDTGAGLPPEGARIEIQLFPAASPISEDNPIYIEAPWGELVRDVYDGAYSPYDPKLRYDAAAVAAVGTGSGAPIARLKVTEAADDIKTWLEEHVYQPLGYAPALSADGVIRPVSDALPGAGAPIVYLTDANTVSATWAQRTGEVINTVRIDAITEIVGQVEGSDANANALTITDIVRPVQFTSVASMGLFGERDLTLSGLALRSFQLASGGGVAAGASADLATVVARRRYDTLRDRRAFGAYEVTATCLRTDPDVEGADVGRWVVIADKALPEFTTRKRGSNRLMQIVRRQDVSQIETVFTLADAGPAAVPVGMPTIAAAADAGDGRASVTVTAAPSLTAPGGRVVVEYAVSATPPATGAAWWLLGTLEAGTVTPPVTLTTPPIGAGTVWFRARGEAPGRIASAPTALVSAAIGVGPVLTAVALVWDADATGTPRYTLTWSANAPTAGLLVEWAVYAAGTAPPTSYTGSQAVDADALLDYEIPVDLAAGQALAVRVTPRAGYTGGTGGVGGTLSGAAGIAVERSADAAVGDDLIIPPAEQVPTLAPRAEYTSATQGRAWLRVADPSGKVTSVAARASSGGGPWSEPVAAAVSGGEYYHDVTLAEGQPSAVEFVVTYVDIDGASQIMREIVPFPLRVVPKILSLTMRPFGRLRASPGPNTTGSASAKAIVDEKTGSVRFLARTDRYPTEAEVIASGVVVNVDPATRDVYSDPLVTITFGGTAYGAALPYSGANASGERGALVTDDWSYAEGQPSTIGRDRADSQTVYKDVLANFTVRPQINGQSVVAQGDAPTFAPDLQVPRITHIRGDGYTHTTAGQVDHYQIGWQNDTRYQASGPTLVASSFGGISFHVQGTERLVIPPAGGIQVNGSIGATGVVQGATGDFDTMHLGTALTVGGLPISGQIISTSPPSGTAPEGTVWNMVSS